MFTTPSCAIPITWEKVGLSLRTVSESQNDWPVPQKEEEELAMAATSALWNYSSFVSKSTQ